jgi:hypothetical protein
VFSHYVDAVLAGKGHRQTEDVYTRGYPGFFELWRMYLKSHEGKENHETWVVNILKRAIMIDLRFAHDIFHYWNYKESPEVELKKINPMITDLYIQMLRETFTENPALLCDVLSAEEPYTLFWITNAPSQAKIDTPETLDFRWLGTALLEASRNCPVKIVPQLIPLISDHSLHPEEEHPRYQSRLELMDNMFGERSREVMTLIDAHLGSMMVDEKFEEHKIATIEIARKWLGEDKSSKQNLRSSRTPTLLSAILLDDVF